MSDNSTLLKHETTPKLVAAHYLAVFIFDMMGNVLPFKMHLVTLIFFYDLAVLGFYATILIEVSKEKSHRLHE